MDIISLFLLLLTALTCAVFLASRKSSLIVYYPSNKQASDVFLYLKEEGTFFNFNPVVGEGSGKFSAFGKGSTRTKKEGIAKKLPSLLSFWP